MNGLGVLQRIRLLNETEAVGLAHQLMMAEEGRHGLPLGLSSITARVKARDGGVDARTAYPSEVNMLLPRENCVWQIKSGSTAPSASGEFDPAKRAELVGEIQDGRDYVLFWANDPADPNDGKVRAEFADAVAAIRPDAVVYFLFANEIDRLCRAHLAVLAQLLPGALHGLVGSSTWARTFADVPFQPDESRDTLTTILRDHATSTDAERPTIHVFGDTGVGKSRLVQHALSTVGLIERVLVCPDASTWDPGLLADVVEDAQGGLILVADECDSERSRALAKYAAMAGGRIRLITIGPRPSRERPAADARFLELLPLEASACAAIATAVGLAETDARIVAQFTEGYPGLASMLAKAIHFGPDGSSLIERIRSHQEIGPILAGLLPDEDAELLGLLALFEKIGYDDEFRTELTIACTTLGIDEQHLRRVADRELDRFVSTAGRFRRVSPRLFAVWLASRFMSKRGDSLTTALSELPEFMRDRILDQMADFAGDPIVAESLGALLNQPPFDRGAFADVDGGAARLIHVAALAAPEQSMDAIERIMDGVSTDELRHHAAARRELVMALELLLWYQHLFGRAADALLQLAAGENESWANNATGAIKGIFGIFLGGTSASFDERLGWARSARKKFGDSIDHLLVAALQRAFDPHETRSAPNFGGRTAPVEWRPATNAIETESRGAAWDLLLEIGATSTTAADQVPHVIARGLRTALRRGPTSRILADLASITFEAGGRAEVGDAIAKALTYDNPPKEVADELERIAEALHGGNVRERFDYVTSLSPWQLTTESELKHGGRPRMVAELAVELANADSSVLLDTAQRSIGRDQQTVEMLFAAVGELRGDPADLEAFVALIPRPDAAIVGILVGTAKTQGESWVDRRLAESLDDSLGDLVVNVVHQMPATDHRAAMAVRSVELGRAPQTALSRFLYGAWTRPLTEPAVCALTESLASEGSPFAIEHALGILNQWAEQFRDDELGGQFRSLAQELIVRSAMIGESNDMGDFYRAALLRRIGMTFEDRLKLLGRRLQHLDTFLDQQDLELVDSLMLENPQATLESILNWLLTDSPIPLMWLEHTRVLSHCARAAPEFTDFVNFVLSIVDESSWSRIINHVDCYTDPPDGLLVAFLDNSSDPVIAGRASFGFCYPGGAWSGPESVLLTERRELANEWRQLYPEHVGFLRWLDVVIADLEVQIQVAQRREDERGF